MKKALLVLLFFALYNFTFSQTAPPNTRLFQLNTVKGSVLSLVEMSDNYVYHVGTTNSSEVGFDGLAATTVGLDDLYILKSIAANGTNVWFKTFNAGTNGTMNARYVYIDSSENVYVFGQFKGTITVKGRTINGVNANDAFLMKIDPNGNAVWVQYFENGYKQAQNVKAVTDGIDSFLVYNNNLARLNDSDGSKIFTTEYNCELYSVALNNSTLYLAGSANVDPLTFGNLVVEFASGFVLKGDKNAVFNAVLKTERNTYVTKITDIAFDNDGKLLLTGFNNNSIDLVTQTQTVNYTFNPNSNPPPNRLYYFTAKIDANLEIVDFFRTSSPIGIAIPYIYAEIYLASLKIKNSGFNLLLSFKSLYSDTYKTITHSNSSSLTQPLQTKKGNYHILLQADPTGNYVSGKQDYFFGSKMSSNSAKYSEPFQNIRVFSTEVYNSETGVLDWKKEKSSSVGGTLSGQFIKHFQSDKNDVLVTAVSEGTSNFFGKTIVNAPGGYSTNIARLKQDGLPKWFADISSYVQKDVKVTGSNLTTLDKNDNIFILSSISGTSVLTDAIGNQITFNGNANSSDKTIVKLDQNGQYLWSKHLVNNGTSLFGKVITDNAGNVYIVGTRGKLTLENHVLNGGVFVIKLDSNGNYIYGKAYPNLSVYNLSPVFDSEDNLFLQCYTMGADNDYILDGVTIPANSDLSDHLMLKFSATGSVIWGKNFTLGSNTRNASTTVDVVFDGADFIITGNYIGNTTDDFSGLNQVLIPRVYPNVDYTPFVAKISTLGEVIWQKALYNNNGYSEFFPDLEIDANKNIYLYWFAKDKITYNGTEYSFDSTIGNNILTKIDPSGNLKYFKAIDRSPSTTLSVDVIGDDQINLSGFTSANNIFNYPINNQLASNLYLATFGNLDSSYLTPTKDYLQLNNISMENNPDNANTFSFDLINNVDWTANSDQPWLNLSFLSLTEKNNFKNLISGNGDAKITMSATTNTSGASRSATVVVSGTSVDSKSIIVTQSFILATGVTKTFVTTLYPNPTSDLLNIETKQNISKIEIYDLSGRLVKTGAGKEKQISVSALNKGIYLIKLYTESGVINSKFIKN